MAPERPQVDKPEGDIPFELGIDDVTVGDGRRGDRRDEGVRALRRRRLLAPARSSTPPGTAASRSSSSSARARSSRAGTRASQGMKVGGRRKLTIPSAMAYGARGAGDVIAPHEPLVFVVDLLSVD